MKKLIKKYLIKIDNSYEFKFYHLILKKLNNIDLIVEFNINNPQNDKLFNLLKNFDIILFNDK